MKILSNRYDFLSITHGSQKLWLFLLLKDTIINEQKKRKSYEAILTQCFHLSHQKLFLNIFLISVLFNCSVHLIEYLKFFHYKYRDWPHPKHHVRVHGYRSFCIQGTACGVDKPDADELPFLPKCNFALNGSWLWRPSSPLYCSDKSPRQIRL